MHALLGIDNPGYSVLRLEHLGLDYHGTLACDGGLLDGVRDRLEALRSIMDWKLLFTVFATIFVAEIGDKTQLATLLYASGAEANRLTVFLGSSLALILTSALGVIVGTMLSQYLNPRYLAWVAGGGFIIVGIWTIMKA
jgi:putative Ca2+/H+ antiporter (TMEM165/GDT1 family)